MLFNLNEFLMAVSFTLDFVEIDILGVTSNHGKRTAYISLKIAEELGMNKEELHDVVALAILHDNGISEKSLHDRILVDDSIDVKSIERIKEHCTIGEKNIEKYPFLTNVKDTIKYHHENYDGTGYFKLKSEEIPLMSQVIHIADFIEVNFELVNNASNVKNKLLKFINEQNNKMFSSRIVNALNNVAEDKGFWSNLKNEHIDQELKKDTPQFSIEMSFNKIKEITGVFSRIIDSKSKYTQRHSYDLSKKAEIMADYYKMDINEKMKLIIAADLHDIGKLAVPNKILDSPNKLTNDEFNIIKKHTYYTRLALQEIQGFEDITEWAANHHEKLNGKGYPLGKTAEELDFNSRLMTCLDIYEALTEERPYRVGLSHKETMDILNEMNKDGFIDAEITKDVDYVFKNVSF